jgi:hypothetical protein
MSRDETLIVGRLREHGAAPYQFRADQDASYFVKVLTVEGERILWGKDLRRAVAESASKPQIGDVVGVRRTFREAVTITERTPGRDGRPAGETRRPAYRYRWMVEKAAFLAERAKLARRVTNEHLEGRRAVKARPELVSTYLSIRGAEDIAERRIKDPKDRERFLALVREAIGQSIKDGKPLPTVQIRNQTKAGSKPSSPKVARDDERTR